MRKPNAKTSARILSAFLAGLILASCSTPDDKKGDDTTAGSDTTTAETTTAETELTDDLPDVDFDGYDFRIFVDDDYVKYFYADEQTGEAVNDAVYEANMEVKNRFNINMSTVRQSTWTASGEIQTLVASGENAFDMSYTHDTSAAKLALQGLFVNLYDVPHLNFEKPWWPKFTTETLTMNGKMYLISNYSSWYGFYATRTMFFNIDLVEDNNMESPYELVKNNEWTLDKLIEMTSDFYKDVDGDGERDYDDIYGFAMTVPYALLENFGYEALTKSDDGKTVSLGLYNEGTVDLMNKMENWLISGKTGTVFSNSHSGRYNEDSSNTWFSNGKILYTYGAIGHLLQGLADTDTNYGILPMPKLTEDSEFIGACCELPGVIPVTNENLDRTGVIVEAMASSGYKYVIPQYYEYALKGRYSTDADSCAMLDILFENRVLSLSYLYVPTMQQMVEKVLASGGNFASWYETNKNTVQETIDTINEFYNRTGE